MFYYTLYNRKFLSDIMLFNIPLSTTFSNPDVTIHAGYIDCDKIFDKSQNFYIHKEYALVRTKYGSLRIDSGKEIIYYLNGDYDPECITPYIMGWGMAFVLTQMNLSAFHCSALSLNNQGFFISGVSGAGKSTTALQLIKRGCKYLCDDIAVVDSFEKMMIPPAFPIQKVCPDITSNLNKDLLYQIKNDRGKYSYLNTDEYCDTPKKLTVIFKLFTGDVSKVEVKEITGINKYLRVIECLFLEVQYLLINHLPNEEKFRCLKIAGNVRLFSITRPKEQNTVDEIADIIFQIMNKQGR